MVASVERHQDLQHGCDWGLCVPVQEGASTTDSMFLFYLDSVYLKILSRTVMVRYYFCCHYYCCSYYY